MPLDYKGPIECRICHRTLPHTDFYIRNSGRRRRRTDCRFCSIARAKAGAARIVPGDAQWVRRRSRKLMRKYGITHEDFLAMAEAQGGKCALCDKVPAILRRDAKTHTSWTALHVDHDHVNDRIRGLLCLSCNIMLGKFEDIGPATIIGYLQGSR
jgi:Recombination endonuclease VII